MNTLDRIMSLIAERGIEQQKLADYLGINKQVITDWKSGKSKSYNKYLGKIAEFFNVSSDYLQGIRFSDEATAQNSTERRVLLLARKAADIPEEQRERIIKNFEDTIDLYLGSKDINKED
jgi:transcriptional regulator with XRE-family HTH domain